MMQIFLANPRGFCAGVDRAIDIVERAVVLFGAPIYVRHEVVHNKYVVDRLRTELPQLYPLRHEHEALVERVLKAGGNQPLALGWKSLLLGVRGDSAGALAAAREAVAQGRANGFAQFALGSALLSSGDLEAARKAFREAHTLVPGLLVDEVRVAEIDARTGGIPAARERLQRVIALDPEYASARRALYLLPPEG